MTPLLVTTWKALVPVMLIDGAGDDVVGIDGVGHGFVVDVARENGDVCLPVAVGMVILCGSKAAIDGHIVLQLEGAVSVVSGLACAFIGIVDTFGHPDFTGVGDLERILHMGKGIGLIAVVLVASTALLDIEYAARWTGQLASLVAEDGAFWYLGGERIGHLEVSCSLDV